MAGTVGGNLGLTHSWAYRESGWKPGMDANLLKLDALVQLEVISDTVTAPPGGESDGDRYIIPSGATGDWSGKTGQIAVYVVDAYTYYTPNEGWLAWVTSKSAFYVYTNSAWAGSGAPLLPGTWSNPYIFGDGAAYMWFNATQGFFRGKAGSVPSSDDDGNFIPFG